VPKASAFERPYYADEPRVQKRGDICVGLGLALFTGPEEEHTEAQLRWCDSDLFYECCLRRVLDIVNPASALQRVDDSLNRIPYQRGMFYAPIDEDSDAFFFEAREEMPCQPLGANAHILKQVVQGAKVDFSCAIACEGQMMRCFLNSRTNLERFAFFELWLCVVLRFVRIERCFPLFDVHGMVATYYSYVAEMSASGIPADRALVVEGFWESVVFDLLWFRNKELPLEKFTITLGRSAQNRHLSETEVFAKVYGDRQKPSRPEKCGFLTFYYLGKGGLLSAALCFPNAVVSSADGVVRLGRMHCYMCYLGHICSAMGGQPLLKAENNTAPKQELSV